MYLREWLYDKKIEIGDFADLIGIHRCYMSSIMTGWRKPSKRLSERIWSIVGDKVKITDYKPRRKWQKAQQEQRKSKIRIGK